jgi:hypothetical protein
LANKVTITRRTLGARHTVVMLEINGRVYAATYAPDSDTSDAVVMADLRLYGYGARARRGFRPYDLSRGVLPMTIPANPYDELNKRIQLAIAEDDYPVCESCEHCASDLTK